ncbi:hypothetical protein LEP1GSC036_2634 [Leptospira weilii str. 2006001853]|uniref:Tetratricopeptide repeat protein n=1 Tax=Leptospira weilii str. 2006001853 TaxID=1001589 RepID=A0A828Z7B0_9LEPT|nr:hypothetical protein [Leptospira weilii]EKR65767.1 hypothetical protein LEP1GSC036_2634 [Leptospira weilii str. 2006001853]EMN45616.1 hypothetical protein LEP1GSC086_2684 [Leptospira weilii str. LNT 1234]MCL8268605.1 hypothetical protein [Leptospira weilii]QDK23034.1 hypothetical protein FHG67_10130 [Leptospira weilii]QDK27322.1 hypothetical protein FHG68_12105 [Leptospira weilii]
MHETLFQNLIEELPAGEYRNVMRFIPSGSMMGDFPVIFANAESVRNPQKRFFIKCIWVADQNAGDNTKLVTNATRLHRIYNDLKNATLAEKKIPIVDLAELKFLENDSALLIVMDLLTPLKQLIEEGKISKSKVREFIRVFANTNEEKLDWIHFDLCPKNLGVNSKNEFRLIDLDSFYKAKEGKFEVKTLAYKRCNILKSINDKIIERSDDEKYYSIELIKKFKLEICLCAIQIWAGELFRYPGKVYNLEEWFWAWLNSLPNKSQSEKAFWKKVIEDYIPKNISLNQIANEYEQEILEESSASSDSTFHELPLISKDVNNAAISQNEIYPANEIDKVFDHYAKLIRSENFNVDDLQFYLDLLKEAVDKAPNRVDHWIELVTISICYLKSAKKSYEYLQIALRYHNQNQDLKNKMRLVELWMQ